MVSSIRHKVTIITLLFYWVVLFVTTHIPVPIWVGQLDVSDKTLHYVAYLILAFLLWFAINPYKKVNWRKAAVWWILLVVVWYGVFDECLQAYVGRNADVKDFFADLAGAVTGLVLLTIFHFWPACLAITGSTIFIFTNISRVNPADFIHVTNAVLYFFAYGFFTLLWIRCMHNLLPLRAPEPKWLIGVLSLPTAFLLSTELFALITGSTLELWRVIVSAAAITAVIVVFSLAALLHKTLTRKPSPGDI